MIKIKTIEDVVNYQLCTGCGMCEASEPSRYSMIDVESFGLRPQLIQNAAAATGDAFKSCPGHSLEHRYDRTDSMLIKELEDCWGPVYGVWEGYASNQEIRFKGSSGGAATALALFGLESQSNSKVYQTGPSSNHPLSNSAQISNTQQQLLENAGSRYSPASPCTAVKQIQPDNTEFAIFIGKPCDVAAVSKWESLSEKNNVGIKIGFFCAGTPSTQGNKALLTKFGIDFNRLTKIKFRGQGWPGLWKADYINGSGVTQSAETTYAESWGFLQRFRQWRCYICPDHTAEFADIAVGDPWYRKVEAGELGKSLIVARTKKGLKYLQDAERAKYIVLEQENADLLPLSQPNLVKARGDLWGRLLTLKMMGVPTPKFSGFKLFPFWLRLGVKDKLASFIGTASRVKRKKLKLNQHIVEGAQKIKP